MHKLWQDLRYALRMMVKTPSLTVVAMMTLALGIGANSAVFSVINAVLLRPLPYDHPERVMMIRNAPVTLNKKWSAATFFDWRDRAQSFESLAAYDPVSGGVNLTGDAEPVRIEAAEVTSGFFQTLGVTLLQGRTFTPEDDKAGNSHIAVISYGLWQRRFGADNAIVGQTIRLNEVPFTVIGVAPSGLQFPARVDVWLPVADFSERILSGPVIMFNTVGRLKSDVTLPQARAEMRAFSEWLKQAFPEENAAVDSVTLTPLHDDLVQKVRPALLILFGAVGLVMLIVCVNVTNLLLARATARHKEMAIRAALGAGRWQLARQMLIESSLLAVLGGSAGLLLALWCVDLLKILGPAEIPRLHEVRLDAVVFGFTFGVSLLTGFLFGLAPALHASKVDLNEALKEGAAKAGQGVRWFGLRNLLVITEVALALVLLIGAGLLIKSFFHVLNVPPGFDAKNVLTIAFDLPEANYNTETQRAAFYQQLIERLGALPGVQSVGATSALPLSTRSTAAFIFSEAGAPPAEPSMIRMATYVTITPDYLQAMGIPIVEGRGITAQDKQGAPPAILVSRSLAQRFWPNESPIGKRIALFMDKAPREIVGVVGDVKQWGLESQLGLPIIYIPHEQLFWSVTTVAIRSNTDMTSLTGSVRSEVLALDKNLPLYDVKTMEQRLADSRAERRFTLVLLGAFAALALALAATGIYGVMNYSVVQRTREIGIRMALGAERKDVLRLIIGRGLLLALAGIAIGLAASFALTRLLATLLFNVSATDPTTFVALAAVLTAVALGACAIPAHRATRVDPTVTLRYE